MTAFLVIMFLVNIFLWIFFIFKFRKIFSPSGEVQKVRTEMNNMLKDIDRATERDLSILDDRIQKLTALIELADKRIALASTEEAKQAKAEKIRNIVRKPAHQKVHSAYKKADESYKITSSGVREVSSQISLFAEDAKSESSSVESSRVVKKDGTSYAEVPIIEPEIYFSDSPIEPDKSFSKKVSEFASLGMSVQEIAKKLSCSITEVQMVLDMG